MKKPLMVLGVLALVFLVRPVWVSAQGEMMGMRHEGMGQDMMKGKQMSCPMMQGMMKGCPCPMCSSSGKSLEGMKSKSKDMDEMFGRKVKHLLMMADELGLTDEQKKSILSLKMSVKKDMVMREAQIEVAGIDIQSKMMDDPMDVNAVNSLIDKKYDLKKEKAKVLVMACADLKKILTDEQKRKVKGMMFGQMGAEQMEEQPE